MAEACKQLGFYDEEAIYRKLIADCKASGIKPQTKASLQAAAADSAQNRSTSAKRTYEANTGASHVPYRLAESAEEVKIDQNNATYQGAASYGNTSMRPRRNLSAARPQGANA